MNVKFIASGAGFAGLGAIVAWAITADLADKNFRHMAEDMVRMHDALREKTRENIDLRYNLADMEEELEKLHTDRDIEAGFGPDFEGSTEINTGGEIEEVHNEPEPSDEEIAETRSNLQNLISQYTPDPADQQMFVDRGTRVVESTKYDPPFVIPQSEYAWSEEGDEHAKITLRYFPQQQVLLDEDEEPIDDVESYVGWRSLSRFGDETDNPNVVYVRNRRLETDFEIERETEEDLPLHVKYAMPKMEFQSQRAAGKLRLQEEDG